MLTDSNSWLILISFAILGALSIYGFFVKTKRDSKKEADAADDRLITLLQGQVNALQTKVNTQEKTIADITEKLDQLVIENRTLRDVLQGRDAAAQAYQSKGLEAFKTAEEVLNIVKRTESNVDRLVGTTVIETKTKRIKRI